MKFELNEYHRNVSNEELLNDVKRVINIYQKDSLTQKEYLKYGKYGKNTFRRRFKSWNMVLELCGLHANVYQIAAAKGSHNYAKVTTEQLIHDLQRVSTILDMSTISSKIYQQYGKYSCATYFKRFGTWNNALEKAGLKSFEKVPGKKIDDEKLLMEIERLWVKLGRQPTTTDIKNNISKYSLNTFSRRFGSWRKTLEYFVTYVNSEGTLELNDLEYENQEIHKYKEKEYPNSFEEDISLKHKTSRDINLRLRFKVMRRDNFKCCLCGASPAKDPSVELHIDHIKPWSKGGETVMENLQTLCSKCNLGKSDLE